MRGGATLGSFRHALFSRRARPRSSAVCPASPQQQRDLRARDTHEPGVVLANLTFFFGRADDSRADHEEMPKLWRRTQRQDPHAIDVLQDKQVRHLAPATQQAGRCRLPSLQAAHGLEVIHEGYLQQALETALLLAEVGVAPEPRLIMELVELQPPEPAS